MWNSLLDLLGSILAFSYGVVPSYGIAIVVLTVLVRLMLYPLTAKQARSMLEMQKVQPEIKKLQAKYKGDRAKLNEEMAALFKEHGVNPLAGCLPLVAQMPVLSALFSLLRNVDAHVPRSSDIYQAMCGTGSGSCANPKGLRFLGMDLSIAPNGNHDGFLDALPYFALVALVVLTGLLQSRQMRIRQSKMNANAEPNAQMQMMGRIMPVMFGFFSLSMPTGLSIYFFVSNLWQVGQQAVVYRHAHVPVFGPSSDDSVADDNGTKRALASGDGGKKVDPSTPENPAARPAPKKQRNKKKRKR
ncbi:MAG: YidC/Oxa1 family membrane protein insertase [Nitrospirota bacterium]